MSRAQCPGAGRCHSRYASGLTSQSTRSARLNRTALLFLCSSAFITVNLIPPPHAACVTCLRTTLAPPACAQRLRHLPAHNACATCQRLRTTAPMPFARRVQQPAQRLEVVEDVAAAASIGAPTGKCVKMARVQSDGRLSAGLRIALRTRARMQAPRTGHEHVHAAPPSLRGRTDVHWLQ